MGSAPLPRSDLLEARDDASSIRARGSDRQPEAGHSPVNASWPVRVILLSLIGLLEAAWVAGTIERAVVASLGRGIRDATRASRTDTRGRNNRP